MNMRLLTFVLIGIAIGLWVVPHIEAATGFRLPRV